MSHTLSIRDMSCEIRLRRSVVHAVSNLDLHLDRGETLGLVGESGCGKSMTALAVMGLLPPGGQVVQGSISLEGRELVGLDDARYRTVRGNDIAMVFQDSMSALDPTKSIGFQVAEPLRVHRGSRKAEALERAAEVLSLVGIPRPRERMDDYPHQLSGGMRQRVVIAMALTCEPRVLIADEPTTALDVTVQAQVLELLHSLKERLGMAMLLITHDMGVVAEWTDRVSVMYAGRQVESAGKGELFDHMHHPYTQALLASIPRLDQDSSVSLHAIPGRPPELSALPIGCRFSPRCAHARDECRQSEPAMTVEGDHQFACFHPVDGPQEAGVAASGQPRSAAGSARPASDAGSAPPDAAHDVADDRAGADGAATGTEAAAAPILAVTGLVKEFPVHRTLSRHGGGVVHAISGVSFSVRRGETFGLVGESGCGKSTLARTLVVLERPTSGSVVAQGEDVLALRGRDLRVRRRQLQMMFQDPFDALDPRMRVAGILREPLVAQGIGSRREQMARVRSLLEEVGLPESALERYPHEFSGGQRQRIGLARALASNPRVIVADEPVSALDVSIRSQVLNLMKRMQDAHGLTYVVISHDLTVVKYMAKRVGVMYLGKLVEVGPSDAVYERPAHPYTAGLIAAIPDPDSRARRRAERSEHAISGEPPSPIDPPSGCRFRTRCPFAQDRCAEEEPLLRTFAEGHLAACHFPLREPDDRSS